LSGSDLFRMLAGMNLVKDKITQASSVLAELGLDLWLIFVRETTMQADPTLAMVVGRECTWQSFFAFTPKGDAIALVGNLDIENFTRDDCFTEVRPYTTGVKDDLRAMIERLDPQQIAVNYSLNDPAADGLTHGMYLLLQEYLAGTVYADRLVSAETLAAKLRSRKLPAEVDLLAAAGQTALAVWDEVVPQFRTGMSEAAIAEIIDRTIAEHEGTNSFETIVNAGDKTAPGHGRPSAAKLAPGDLLHVDFGVKLDGYCSDLQRLVYYRRPQEKRAPAELIDAFGLVNEIITETARIARPAVKGYEIDAVAREMLTDHGYPEYQHALGHQLGRDVHDGGAIIGPQWERYGVTPGLPLEEGNVFTLELEINLPGIGCVGLEEDVEITIDGARFLCPRQLELTII